jgi:coenzyme F420 hydrogenase subunit beta
MHKDKPITFIARTREEIIEASTSKYCPVSINMALKEIINSDNNEKFAVVGLPCHIQGIRNAMAKVKNLEKKIILCLGLFCAKGVSFLGSEYLFRKMNIDVKKIKNISYRGNGWPGKLSISMDEVSDPIEIEYPIIYEYFSFFQFWRCNFCPDASCELSDISFADAWLPRYMSADKIGRSIVVTRTDAGDKIIRSMANQGIIDLNSISYDDVLKSQDCFIWKKRDLIARQKIAEIFRRDVPKNCCNNMYTHLPLKSYPISLVSLVLREIALDRRLWPILDLFHKGRY